LHELAELLKEQLPSDEAGDTVVQMECPFPGLESFDLERSHVFLGRHSEILEALGKFGRTPQGYLRWLQLEGDSGVGKSSLARAGLVPAIQSGWLEGAPSHWETCIVRPGRLPIVNLAAALRKTGLFKDSIGAIEKRLLADEQSLRDLLREGLTG